jgi:hypothetical protein
MVQGGGVRKDISIAGKSFDKMNAGVDDGSGSVSNGLSSSESEKSNKASSKSSSSSSESESSGGSGGESPVRNSDVKKRKPYKKRVKKSPISERVTKEYKIMILKA